MSFKKILIYFLGWRIILQVILILSLAVLPLQMNFLGGGIKNYLEKPYLWAWANFDGEHYIGIAQNGYTALTHFFFPVYPALIKQMVTIIGNGSLIDYLYSSLLISNLAFFLGLLGLVKLVILDHEAVVAKITVILLLLFPTSYYLGAGYTEGLFFALIVWAFYFARRQNWLLAGILGGIASATRITGIALFPAFLTEYFLSPRKTFSFNQSLLGKDPRQILKGTLPILLVPAGLLVYMFYLFIVTGDHLAFYHNLNTVYGDQRSSYLVTLPQVFYRYFFRLLPNINYDYLPLVFTTYMEITLGLVFLALTTAVFLKRRLSEGLFSLFAYLIPTLSGSFSSFPRYVLIIFPVFILAATYLNKTSTIIRYAVYILLALTLIISESLFIRGYWVS